MEEEGGGVRVEGCAGVEGEHGLGPMFGDGPLGRLKRGAEQLAAGVPKPHILLRHRLTRPLNALSPPEYACSVSRRVSLSARAVG